MSESNEVRRIAQIIYDELEGPIANQDAGRQMRQWNMCVKIAQAIEAKFLTQGSGK